MIELRQTVRDHLLVPTRTILLLQEKNAAGRVEARREVSRLEQEQREERMRFRRVGGRIVLEQSREANGFVAQVATNQVAPLRCIVTLIEKQVEDVQHRSQPRSKLRTERNFERYFAFPEPCARPRQPLRNGFRGYQKSPGDFAHTESAQCLQGQRDLRFARKSRVTAGKDQAQLIVSDLVHHKRARRL